MKSNTKQYHDFIADELDKLEDGTFTGSIEFQINMKDGAVGNMNVKLNKSVRLIKIA